jgi:hypothetical protein
MLPVAMVTGAVMHGLDATNADLESALNGWAAGVANGIVVAGAIGLVMIPEPTTSAAGGTVLAAEMARAGAISAVGRGVLATSEEAASAIGDSDTGDSDTGTGLTVGDVGSMVVGELRVPLAEALAAETGAEMPDIRDSDGEVIPPGERWDSDGDWLNRTDELIDSATPDGTENPVIQLDVLVGRQVSEEKYPDPENDGWKRE